MDKQLLLSISKAHDALSSLWLELRDDEQKARVQEMMNQLTEMVEGEPNQDITL